MKLRECLIADQSHVVLDGLGREVVGLHLAVERKLAAIGDPDIEWSTQTGETSFWAAMRGKRRDLLVIENKRFPEHRVVVMATTHGSALHVVWMVLIEPRLAKDMRRALRVDVEPGSRFEIGSELDPIDSLDLRAFLDITRMALKYAIRELTSNEPGRDTDLIVGPPQLE